MEGPDHTGIFKLTLHMRNNYTKDGKTHKTVSDLYTRANLPDFPRALWKKVVSDEYVDLAKVVGGLESSEGDRRQIHTFGDFEIGLGKEPASHAITSSSDWTQAYEAYSAAVLFAYPHRGPELQAYREFILGTFKSVGHANRQLAVTFDRRCRLAYERRYRAALSDTSQFSDLERELVMQVAQGRNNRDPFGGPSNQRHPNPNPNQSEMPICRRFNRGQCQGFNCRYRHVCAICNQSGHTADVCPTKKGPDNAAAGGSRRTGNGGGKST